MLNLPLQFYCMVLASIFFIVVVLNWVMSPTPLVFLTFFLFFFFYVYGFFITIYVSVDFLT